ncbi:hypothetical protein LALA110947_01910 [Lactococcus laudensis]
MIEWRASIKIEIGTKVSNKYSFWKIRQIKKVDSDNQFDYLSLLFSFND